MSSGLAPLILTETACADCGMQCRREIDRNPTTGKIRAVVFHCDPCKRSWRTSPSYINAEVMKYVAPSATQHDIKNDRGSLLVAAAPEVPSAGA